jgi:hypothetical protein
MVAVLVEKDGQRRVERRGSRLTEKVSRAIISKPSIVVRQYNPVKISLGIG